ncbi:MAG TPA: mannose-1-phosphate guanylyltransferase [Thermoanaerobaculia bacterium]|jgi:mannose-1-phosphate guanylyltransferase|nr:mannose-1-phosphate guanylyltransferase [Thermoanaerobaculia bacterium]
MKRAAVILAGGGGTRLHPLSTEDNPKQFLKLFDGQSLLQKTFARLSRVVADVYVSTIERYRQKCIEQLPLVEPENVITEPARRNTGPAIALCTFTIESRIGESVVAFLPSDHYIGDEGEFARVLVRAFEHAERTDDLVTIGIEPTEPNTGFGYLELGEEIAPGVLRLRRFTEKPTRERAEEFLRAGNYAWNGGIFVWRTSVFRRELERVAPEISFVTLENYDGMPSISIDYALMEKSRNVATVRGEFGWSDVGSFEALRRVGVQV